MIRIEPMIGKIGTGQASGTDKDLVALFDDEHSAHIVDGFRGGSEDEPEATKPT